jgi:hypothetical protein
MGQKALFPRGCPSQCDVQTEKGSAGLIEKDGTMTSSEQGGIGEGASRIIESAREAEEFALEAVRKFVDTVDSVFPGDGEDGARRKVIDSAFKMTEQLVGSWSQVAEKILKATSEALTKSKTDTGSSD